MLLCSCYKTYTLRLLVGSSLAIADLLKLLFVRRCGACWEGTRHPNRRALSLLLLLYCQCQCQILALLYIWGGIFHCWVTFPECPTYHTILKLEFPLSLSNAAIRTHVTNFQSGLLIWKVPYAPVTNVPYLAQLLSSNGNCWVKLNTAAAICLYVDGNKVSSQEMSLTISLTTSGSS